jgi:hypothetical protein
MSIQSQFVRPISDGPVTDDLAEGNLFVELQVPSWPPPVSQTLLRNRDARRGLTIRAKPSGRLRVELVRQGYEPLIVRTLHLRLRAPGLLRLNVAWRGDDAVVAAGGQIIGTSRDFSPEGFVAPETVGETAAPLDHVDNERARLSRRRRAEALLQQVEADDGHAAGWFEALGATAAVVTDLVELVRQGRRHHLPGLVDALARLVSGDAPLLQWCAALLDAPLTVYAPTEPSRESSPDALILAAFGVAPARDLQHELAVDLDVWLHHEHPWRAGRQVPVEALLLAVDAALTPPRPDHVDSEDDRTIRAAFTQPAPVVGLCAFASTLCALAASVMDAAQSGDRLQSGADAELSSSAKSP